ncbi:MAG: rhomboid family intramembrane serine protease [Ignavibacteriaceae bacterium]|nr:rhomboid family intramembrane serine protease [Ignavibacteriaceae bacterium]
MSNGYYRPMGFGGFSFFPPVIKNLLIINGAVFFLTVMMENIVVGGVPAGDILMRWFALMPFGSGFFQVWQIITYQFLHGGFGHIFFNMFTLWMFGVELEQIWGSKKFLSYYLLCGVGGGVAHLGLSEFLTGSVPPVIGASGAIFGIMIAFALMFPDRYIFLYFLIPVKTKYFIGFMIVLNLLAIDDRGSGVAHLAHIGGALTGLLFIILDKKTSFGMKDYFGSLRHRRRDEFSRSSSYSANNSGYSSRYDDDERVEDVKYEDIGEEPITQEDIDRILDKISQSGYKNLTDKEKKILFEASKRMK